MGGRGASSGISDSGKRYGTEYITLYQSGNIKFIRYNGGSATAPMETMTNGRVYVTVNKRDDLKSITYYDKTNKRYKQIDVSHTHNVSGKFINPHTHKGYEHIENGTFEPSRKELRMVERVKKTWYNRIDKK